MIDPTMNSHNSISEKERMRIVSLIYLLCSAMFPCQMNIFGEYFPPHTTNIEKKKDSVRSNCIHSYIWLGYQSHLPPDIIASVRHSTPAIVGIHYFYDYLND